MLIFSSSDILEPLSTTDYACLKVRHLSEENTL